MTEPKIRKAAVSDSIWAAEMILATLYEFGTYQVGLGNPDRALRAVIRYFEMPDNRYSYQLSWIAEVDDQPAGLLLVFPGSQFDHLVFQTNLKMLKVYKPGEIVEYIRRMLILRDEEEVGKDEFYIGHLAVSPQFRRAGIGKALLAESERLAAQEGIRKVALMAEFENTNAIALYEKTGFKTVKTFEHPHQIRYTGSPGYVKMVKEI